MGKRKLVALLSLSSCCFLMVVCLFLALPWVCLLFGLRFLCENIAFNINDKFCTAFDRPQLCASEEWCAFIGNEYICTFLTKKLLVTSLM